MSSQEANLAMLPIILQHSEVGRSAATVCALLGTCTAWRSTLQHSNLHCMEASPKPHAIASFAAWLPKHAGLVRELVVYAGMDHESYMERQTLLSLSLQLIAATPAAGAALQLRELQTDLSDPAAFAAIDPFHLTLLTLAHPEYCTSSVTSAAFRSAVGRYAALQEVEIQSASPQILSACLQALRPATQLTKLVIKDMGYTDIEEWGPLPPFPPQLQHLSLDLRGNILSNISQLAGLRALDLDVIDVTEAYALPTGLTRLQVENLNGYPSNIGLLTDLQRLDLQIMYTDENPDDFFPAVAALPQLDFIALDYSERDVPGSDEELPIVKHAPQWAQMTALRSLHIDLAFDKYEIEDDDEEDELISDEGIAAYLLAVAEGLAAAGSIASLTITCYPDSPVSICPYICQLTQLQVLCLYKGDQRLDLLSLSSLTQLRSLSLFECEAVTDAVAVVLVSSLTQLNYLCIGSCGLCTDAVLPLLCNLPSLRRLELVGCEGITDASLVFLTLLTQLTQLQLSKHDWFSDEAVNRLKEHLGARFSLCK